MTIQKRFNGKKFFLMETKNRESPKILRANSRSLSPSKRISSMETFFARSSSFPGVPFFATLSLMLCCRCHRVDLSVFLALYKTCKTINHHNTVYPRIDVELLTYIICINHQFLNFQYINLINHWEEVTQQNLVEFEAFKHHEEAVNAPVKLNRKHCKG